MTLAKGRHLGPYEVISPIGAGGMGEVWHARDTRLERDVAIKVLPATVALTRSSARASSVKPKRSLMADLHGGWKWFAVAR